MDLLLAPTTAFIVTILTTPLAIYLAKKYGLVDNPKTRPHPASIHTSIVPRAGGLSIYLGILTATIVFIPLDKYAIALIASLSLLLVVGLIDDKIKNFSPYARLGLQFLAAIIVVSTGIGISYVTNPFGGILYLDQIISLPYISNLLAIIWIVTAMNVVNWSKGVDGQMPGIIAVASTAIGIIALRFFLQGDQNQFYISLLSFITAAASLGFLLFNWHPAKIFPGFSGSTILGFLIAYLAILSSAKIAAAVLVLLIPFVDAFYTVTRRILSGRSPVWADKDHLHHKLLRLGWSHSRIALFYISTAIFFGVISIFFSSGAKFAILSFFSIACVVSTIILHIILSKGKNK